MAIGPIIRFLIGIRDYISPDSDAVDLVRESAPKHVSYHRRIVVIAAIGGVIGVVGGIAAAIHASHDETQLAREPLTPLYILVCGFIVGLLLGTAVACLFAPREFLTGYVGRKWMRLIGTENVLVARLVCFIVGIGLPLAFASLVFFFPGRK